MHRHDNKILGNNPENHASYPGRTLVVFFCMLFFISVVISGPGRKWVSPEFHQYILFIHIPILFYIYLMCFVFKNITKYNILLIISAIMSVVFVIIFGIQAASDAIIIPDVAVITWIGYFAFIPLSFIIAQNFRQKDIRNFTLISVALMAINASIMYVQKDYFSDDAINQGIGETSDMVFTGLGLIDQKTRPMGFFTSPLANSVFIVMSLSMYWMIFTGRQRLSFGKLFFFTVLAISGTNLVLSGSRFAIFSFALLVATTLICLLATPGKTAARGRMLAQALLALAVVAAVGLAAFPDSAEALSRRFEEAWVEEEASYRSGTLSRLFLESDIEEIIDNAPDTPFFGYGLGTGSNAAHILGYIPDNLYREAPWAKHLNDVGLFFGLLYILLRLAFVVVAGVAAWRLLRRRGDPSAMVFLSQVGLQVFIGQTVSHVVVGPLVWFYFGILLAWIRYENEKIG